jgi:hypothetical protein
MQVNQLHRLAAVGFSQGAPFAFALAVAGLVEAVAIASGQDELTHPRVRPLLHPDVERMVAAVQQDAAAFERHFAEIATAEVLWQLIHGMSSGHDRALYESNEFGTAYQRALREGFSRVQKVTRATWRTSLARGRLLWNQLLLLSICGTAGSIAAPFIRRISA